MREGSYVSKAITVGLAGALIIGPVVVYLASQSPHGQRPLPRLIEVACLNVERGPTLYFANGQIRTSDAVVGTYRFLPAVPGKHGPLIHVEAIGVRQSGEQIAIEAGNEGWSWRYLTDDTVEIYFYPQNRTLAHRCTA